MLGPAPFFIVGICNATPDSFYDGGRYSDTGKAVAHGLEMQAQGADIIDVGGESTRPFATPVDQEEESGRVLPVVQGLLAVREDLVISVDTYRAETARQCLQAGARIVNDISACRYDPSLADVLAHYRPGYVLMHSLDRPRHMQRDPRYQDVVSEVLGFFDRHLTALTRAGLPEENIVLDPGIGFGKNLQHNLSLLAGIGAFKTLGRPLYVGLSNKSLWDKLLGLAAHERGTATQVATALMAERGVCIHRVHEVALTRQTLAITRELHQRSTPAKEAGTE